MNRTLQLKVSKQTNLPLHDLLQFPRKEDPALGCGLLLTWMNSQGTGDGQETTEVHASLGSVATTIFRKLPELGAQKIKQVVSTEQNAHRLV